MTATIHTSGKRSEAEKVQACWHLPICLTFVPYFAFGHVNKMGP